MTRTLNKLRLLTILALVIAGLFLVPWLVDKAAGHTKATCTHGSVYTYNANGFPIWKATMFSWYGDLQHTHDHGHHHYYQSPTNPGWKFMHNAITTGCGGH